MVLRAEAAVLAKKPVGDLPLGHAGADLGDEPVHGLVVDGGGGSHELLLALVLDGARVVDGVRGEGKAGRGAGLHEGHEPAGGELLVDAERRRVVGHVSHKGDRVLGVVERAHVGAGVAHLGEEPVAKHHGLFGLVAGDVERKEALVGLGVVPAEPPDGQGVHQKHLRKAAAPQVGAHVRKAFVVHGLLLSVAASVARGAPDGRRQLPNRCCCRVKGRLNWMDVSPRG